MSRLAVCVLGVAVVTSAAAPAADPSPGFPSTVQNAIAAQRAMASARAHLAEGRNADAVAALEGQLLRADGNTRYLALLRDAYCAYLKELKLAGKDDRYRQIRDCLRQLDPSADPEGSPVVAAPPAPPPAVREAASPSPAPVLPAALPAEPVPVAVPAAVSGPPPTPSPISDAARDLLRKAESAFARDDYESAGRLYEDAAHADPACVAGDARERWAYCKLSGVVAALEKPGRGGRSEEELEAEVRSALAMAPRLEKSVGRDVLAHLRGGAPGKAAPKAGPQTPDGWEVLESASFRVLHHGDAELAGLAARAAEQSRSKAYRRWHGTAPQAEWSPRCDVYIFKTADDYSRATRQPAASNGHSTIHTRGTSVVGRRIDLHADDVNLLPSTLPHECTHVVLADAFAGLPLPRWADEGMAVLAEDPGRLKRYREMLVGYRRDGKLVPAAQLLQSSEYPSAENVTAFYAQSVSVVEFLVGIADGPTFTLFVQACGRYNVDTALKRVYGKHGITGLSDLEQKWSRHASAP